MRVLNAHAIKPSGQRKQDADGKQVSNNGDANERISDYLQKSATSIMLQLAQAAYIVITVHGICQRHNATRCETESVHTEAYGKEWPGSTLTKSATEKQQREESLRS